MLEGQAIPIELPKKANIPDNKYMINIMRGGSFSKKIGEGGCHKKVTWFMSIVWTASPRVKTIAWFWFSGFPSPSLGSPGSLIENTS